MSAQVEVYGAPFQKLPLDLPLGSRAAAAFRSCGIYVVTYTTLFSSIADKFQGAGRSSTPRPYCYQSRTLLWLAARGAYVFRPDI